VIVCAAHRFRGALFGGCVLVERVERVVAVDCGGECHGRGGGGDFEHGTARSLGGFELPHRCE
jgi:hypothetical protein